MASERLTGATVDAASYRSVGGHKVAGSVVDTGTGVIFAD